MVLVMNSQEQQHNASEQPQQPMGTLAIMRLLSVSRIAPIITGFIGYELFGQAYRGVIVGFIIAVMVAAYISRRAGIDQRWNILIWLPIVLWGAGILWYGLTR